MKHERIYFYPEDKRVYIDTYVVIDNRVSARDAMIVIPGGAYAGVCADREGENVALAYTARGINAFVLNYSVGSDIVFPRQLLDAARAMKYIKENYEEFHINPERIFAVGFSAGGHLCGTLATHYKFAEAQLGLPEGYLKLRGALLGYPVVTAKTNTHSGSFTNLLKKPLAEYTDEEREFHSLECNVDEGTPPMFIWHTSEDKGVPIIGSLRLAEAFYNIGRSVELHIYPYGPHGIALGTYHTSAGNQSYIQKKAEKWIDESIEWMNTI